MQFVLWSKPWPPAVTPLDYAIDNDPRSITDYDESGLNQPSSSVRSKSTPPAKRPPPDIGPPPPVKPPPPPPGQPQVKYKADCKM